MTQTITKPSSKKWWVLVGLGIAALIINIDFTIVNTCLAPIQHDLKMPLTQLQWLMTGFGITFCAALTVGGRLADMFGRRKFNYIGVIGFGIASIAAGLSTSPLMLIICRALQGIFAGIIFPSGFALVAHAFPKHEQGRALGIYGAFLGLGLAVGPVLGGVIASTWGWRWIFFINIPVILLSLIICVPILEESRSPEKLTIDWLGLLFILLSLPCLVFAISEGPVYGWLSWPVMTTFILALIFIALLLFTESRQASPLLPLKLFINHGFLLSTMFYKSIVSAIWVVLFLCPLYFSNVLGLDPVKVGLLLLPLTLAACISPSIAGYMYDKLGALFTVIVCFIFMIVAYAMESFFGLSTSIIFICSALIIFGLGWGSGNGVAIPFALSALENNNDAGVVSGAAITILNVSGIIILAISSTIFHYAELGHFYHLINHSALQLDATQQTALAHALVNPSQAASLTQQFSTETLDQLSQLFKLSFVHAFRFVILLLLAFTLICLPFTCYLSYCVDKIKQRKDRTI